MMISTNMMYVNINDITEPIKLIEDSNTDYISVNGNVYKQIKEDLFIKKKTNINPYNDYVYCGITFNEGNKSRRVHRLVAKAFIDNPNKLPVVGHKNNVKNDNRVNNLYWTTVAENTQKAFDDGLEVNDKGIKDSQSIPIACYTNTHNLVSMYGSISEAGRCIDGFTKSSIAKVIDKNTKGLKGYYFKSVSKEEYFNYIGKKNLKFSTNVIQKTRRNFKAISPNGIEYYSDNQKSFAKEHNLTQTAISNILIHKQKGYHKNWYFEAI